MHCTPSVHVRLTAHASSPLSFDPFSRSDTHVDECARLRFVFLSFQLFFTRDTQIVIRKIQDPLSENFIFKHKTVSLIRFASNIILRLKRVTRERGFRYINFILKTLDLFTDPLLREKKDRFKYNFIFKINMINSSEWSEKDHF